MALKNISSADAAIDSYSWPPAFMQPAKLAMLVRPSSLLACV
jgi:hypothetical protein